MSVYNTATAGDVTPGRYYNDGTKWVRYASGSDGLSIGTLTRHATGSTYASSVFSNSDGTSRTDDIIGIVDEVDGSRFGVSNATDGSFASFGKTNFRIENPTKNVSTALQTGSSNVAEQYVGHTGTNNSLWQFRSVGEDADAAWGDNRGQYVFRRAVGASGYIGNYIVLSKDGNTGIGDNLLPSAKLDVDGTARVRSLGTGLSTDNLVTADADGNLRALAASSLKDFSAGAIQRNGGSANASQIMPLKSDGTSRGDDVIGIGDDSFFGISNAVNGSYSYLSGSSVSIYNQTSGVTSSFISGSDNIAQLYIGYGDANSPSQGLWTIITPGEDLPAGWGANRGALKISRTGASGYQGDYMVLSKDGNTGIGANLLPSAKLDVGGYIKVGSSDVSGDATPVAGMMRYNSTTDKFQGYVNDAGSGAAGWVDLN